MASWTARNGHTADKFWSTGIGECESVDQRAFDLLGDPPYTADTWSNWTGALKEATGRKGKQLFMPLRLAVTGQPRGPEMADVMPLLQKKPSL